MPENDKQFYNQGEFVGPTLPTIEPTPYSEWAEQNNISEDTTLSMASYADNLRMQYLDENKYGAAVESDIQEKLYQGLFYKGFLTEENQEDVIQEVKDSYKPTLEQDIDFINTYSKDNTEFNRYESFTVDNYLKDPAGQAEKKEEVEEIVRKTREDVVRKNYASGDIDAGIYYDTEGRRRLVGGRVPENKTVSDVIKGSALGSGVSFYDSLAFLEKRKPIEGTERFTWDSYDPDPNSDSNKLMAYEVDERADVFNLLLESRNKKSPIYDRTIHATLDGLSMRQQQADTWGMRERFSKEVVGNFESILSNYINIPYAYEVVTGDDKAANARRNKIDFKRLTKSYAEDTESAKTNLINYVIQKTDLPKDVIEESITEVMKMMASGRVKGIPTMRAFIEDADRLGENITRTSFHGVFAPPELNLKPDEFKEAFRQAGVSKKQYEIEDTNRHVTVTENYEVYDKILSGDKGYVFEMVGGLDDKWAAAKMEGVQNGLSKHDTLTKFIKEHNPNLGTAGVYVSAHDTWRTPVYGVAAALNFEWGRKGLMNAAEEKAHNRELFLLFGRDVGFGQETVETLAPLAGDAVITAGLAAATPVSGGSSAAGVGFYYSAKQTAKKAVTQAMKAEGLLGKSAAATKALTSGVNATAAARTLVQGTFTSNLRLKTVKDVSGKAVEESMEALVKRVTASGALKDLSSKEILSVLKTYNSSLAKSLDISTSMFVPAAARQGSSTYTTLYTQTVSELTAEHKKDGKWDEGWSEERVKGEAHSLGARGYITTGVVTGLITASMGTMMGGKFAGAEGAFLKGLSYSQLKAATGRLVGRVSSDKTFKKIMKDAVRKTMLKFGAMGAGKLTRDVVSEGFEEGLDTIINGLIEDAFLNKDTPLYDRLSQTFHSIVMGGFLGGGLNLAGTTFRNTSLGKKFGRVDMDQMLLAEEQVLKDFEQGIRDTEYKDAYKKLAQVAPQTAEAVKTISDKNAAMAAIDKYAKPDEAADREGADAASDERADQEPIVVPEFFAENFGEEASQEQTDVDPVEEQTDVDPVEEQSDLDPVEEAAELSSKLAEKAADPEASSVWDGILNTIVDSNPTFEGDIDLTVTTSEIVNRIAETAENPIKLKRSITEGVVGAAQEPTIQQRYEALDAIFTDGEKNFIAARDLLRTLVAGTPEYNAQQEVITKGIANKEMYTPEASSALRIEAKKNKAEELRLEKSLKATLVTQALTKGDNYSIDDIISKGYPIEFKKEHLEQLGLHLEKTDPEHITFVRDTIARKIKEQFPVLSRSKPKNGASILPTFGGTGKVHLDENGDGVFNNDPQRMMTFIHNDIPVPIATAELKRLRETGQLNPAFQISDSMGDFSYVHDIMIPVAGGIVSAKTRMNEVGVSESDYSALQNLVRIFNKVKDVELNKTVKIRSPFLKYDSDVFSEVTLDQLSDQIEGVGTDNSETKNSVLNLLAKNANGSLTKPYLEAAEISVKMELQIKLKQYSLKLAKGEKVGSMPFDLNRIIEKQVNYFSNQQRGRKEKAKQDIAAMVDPESLIHRDPQSFDPNKYQDNYQPPSRTPIEPLPDNKIKSFIDEHVADAVAALESDPKLQKQLNKILTTLNHNGRPWAGDKSTPDTGVGSDVTSTYTPEKTVIEFIHSLARGDVASNLEAVQFIWGLGQQDSPYKTGQDLRNAIRILGLSPPTVDGDVDTDIQFANFMREKLQALAGSTKIYPKDVLAFHRQIRNATAYLQKKSVEDTRSRAEISAENYKQIDELGLVEGRPETVVAAIEEIAKSGKPKQLRPVAKILLRDKEFIRDTKFYIDPSASASAGIYYPDVNGRRVVVLNPDRTGGRGVADTLIHEYIHAFTVDIFSKPPEARTREQNKAIDSLESLRKIVRQKANRIDDAGVKGHILDGTVNVEEFIAYLLTSPAFQKEVKMVTPIDGGRNILVRIFEAVSRFFGGSTKEFKQSLAYALDLTGRGLQEPETASGFRNQIASRIGRAQKNLYQIAKDIGMSEKFADEEALAEAAEEYKSFARSYISSDVALLIDPTSKEALSHNVETNSIIMNPRRVAIKLSKLVTDQNIDPDRANQILAGMLRRQVGHAAAQAMLNKDQIVSVINEMSSADFDRIVRESYPLEEQEAAFERLNSADIVEASKEKQKMALATIVAHVDLATVGETSNQQVAFLSSNPKLIPTFINYLKVFVTKLTYHRSLKDVSPEMRNSVNNVIREIRAMELNYSPVDNELNYDPNKPMEVVETLIRQAMQNNMLAPETTEEDISETQPQVSRLQVDPALLEIGKRDDVRVGTSKLGTKARPLVTSRDSNIGGVTGEGNPDPKAAERLLSTTIPDQLKKISESVKSKTSTSRYILPKEFNRARNPQKKLQILKDYLADNLIALHNSVDPEIRERSKRWYEGANRIANGFANKYGVTSEQVAGVMASLSPQKDWFLNLAQAEQTIEVYTNYQDYEMDSEKFDATLAAVIEVAEAPAKNKKGKSKEERRLMDEQAREERAMIFEKIRGKTLRELKGGDPKLSGWAIRLIAETEFGKGVTNVTPEGEPNGPYLKADGTPVKNGWGSAGETAKALSILEDGTPENISDKLGKYHKVRSFFNNIVSPYSDLGDVTIDTHAVAAAFLMPYAQSAKPVAQNFATGTANSERDGMQGTYHIYADAYRQAADALGIPPYQLQSITWEAIREIYPAKSRNQKNVAEQEKNFKENNIEQARDRILGQGIPKPLWFGTPDAGVLRGAEELIGDDVQKKSISRRGLLFSGRRTSDGGVTDLGVPPIPVRVKPSPVRIQAAVGASQPSTFGGDSSIPSSLPEVKMPEDEIGNFLELLDVPLMDLTEYDIDVKEFGKYSYGNFKKLLIKTFSRSADRRVVEFFDETQSFVDATKEIITDFELKTRRIVKKEERRLSDVAGKPVVIPPELISKASGSTAGTQLTEDQKNKVQKDYDDAIKLSVSQNLMGAFKTDAEDKAAADRDAEVLRLRKVNRDEQIKERDQALADLLTVSEPVYEMVVKMRQLQDQLSLKAMEIFKGTMEPEDLKLAFDLNTGVYMTRSFRMFDDNNFVAKMSDFEDSTYEQEREQAVMYFARQDALSRAEGFAKDEGLSLAAAKIEIKNQVNAKDATHMSEGRRLLEEFIRGYHKAKRAGALGLSTDVSGTNLTLPTEIFQTEGLQKIVVEINEKGNIPEEIRNILGEYKEDQGLSNISRSIAHTAEVVANQSFFNKFKKLGTNVKGGDNWLISSKEFLTNPDTYAKETLIGDLGMVKDSDEFNEALEEFRKKKKERVNWQVITAEGNPSLSPIKGMYAPPEIISNLKSLFGSGTELTDESNQAMQAYRAAERVLRKYSGYSLAMKTLGGVGFYFRNMIGNAMYFGPMQGYYGGTGLLWGEVISAPIGKALETTGVIAESKAAKKSFMINAMLGSHAELDFGLMELRSMNVFGDELVTQELRRLLTGEKPYSEFQHTVEKAAGLNRIVDQHIAAGTKVPDSLKKKIAKLGVKGLNAASTAADVKDSVMSFAGRVAVAADAFYKVGLYKFELSHMLEAALDERSSNPNGEYARLLDKDGKPTKSMRRMAARLVKDTSQSYSRALPIIKGFGKVPLLGSLAAPYVRFAADVPRVMAQGYKQAFKEIRSSNEVIRKRGWKRARGAMLTTTYSVATGKGSIALAVASYKALRGEDDDDINKEPVKQGSSDDASFTLQENAPLWAKGTNPLTMIFGGKLLTLDLTYLNPFAIIHEPIVESITDLIRTKNPARAGMTLLGPEKGLAKPYFKTQIFASALFKSLSTNGEDQYGNPLIREGDGLGISQRVTNLLETGFEPKISKMMRDTYRITFGDKSNKAFETNPLGPIFKEILPVTAYEHDLLKSTEQTLRFTYRMEDQKIQGDLSQVFLSKGSVTRGELEAAYERAAKNKTAQDAKLLKYLKGCYQLNVSLGDLEEIMSTVGYGEQKIKETFLGWSSNIQLRAPEYDRLLEEFPERVADYKYAREKYSNGKSYRSINQ